MGANTVQLDLRGIVAGLLLQAPAIAEGRVTVGRRNPMARQDDSRVYVYLEASSPAEPVFNASHGVWNTLLRIEAAARGLPNGATPVDAEEAADALLAAAYERLQQDPTFGGRVGDCAASGLRWDADEADAQIAVAQLQLFITHAQLRRSLSNP